MSPARPGACGRLVLAVPLLFRAFDCGDVCLAGEASCGEEAAPTAAPGWAQQPEGDRAASDQPCGEVLELLAAGVPKAWKRLEPAVLTGVAESGRWDMAAFGREQLQAKFGDTRVKVFGPAQAALLGGQTARLHSIRRLLPKLRDSSAKQVPYTFDEGFFQDVTAKAAAAVPKWMAMKGGAQLLTMGGPKSGTQFHSHGAAFLTLLAGHKRWYLHRPGTFPNASARALHRSVADWEAEVLPTLTGGAVPITCVQQPGETLLIPDSWAHATVNLDETIGVAWQLYNAATDPCRAGADYMCLLIRFNSASLLGPAQKLAEYRKLFPIAGEVTGGFPMGFLRHIQHYWKASPKEGKSYWKEQRKVVLGFLKAAEPGTDEAILAGALTKALVDQLFTATQDYDKCAKLLLPAALKTPESGVSLPLAQLYGKLGKWGEAREQLERHLRHFPEDADAAGMLEHAAAQTAEGR